MDIVGLIISLVSGAVGGNIAGALMKDKNLGPLLNSVAGVLGGGVGAAILHFFGVGGAGGELDLAAIAQSVASGGVGGGVLLAIVAFVKDQLAKNKAAH